MIAPSDFISALRKVGHVLPAEGRAYVRHAQRRLRDEFAGTKFASRAAATRWREGLTLQHALAQPLYTTPNPERKIHNIAVAARAVTSISIAPGETFSFWRAVGRATARRGYLRSRNLVGGELRQELGGGICQLSGLLYHVGLTLGLGIVERHAHSVDLYQDDNRFTPLGADAAVVFGYKDLRLLNTTEANLVFDVRCEGHALIARALADRALLPTHIEFVRTRDGSATRVVETRQRSGEAWRVIACDEYRVGV
ncbi:MAG: VanW family protein [Myxococcales bacterium]|nr:VanW family protein [Myxococcales bacterium]